MNKYIFDWNDTIHGQTEIEADNGVEAERVFREMSLEKRLAASITDTDKDTLKIKYVDTGLGDIQTGKEWSEIWRQIFWGKMFDCWTKILMSFYEDKREKLL